MKTGTTKRQTGTIAAGVKVIIENGKMRKTIVIKTLDGLAGFITTSGRVSSFIELNK